MKGQVNIEFLGGFIMFMFTVMYVAFATIGTFPYHMDVNEENALKSEAWLLSNSILNATTERSFLNINLVTELNKSCYTEIYRPEIYEKLNVPENRRFSLFMGDYPVLIPTDWNKSNPSGDNKSGEITINSTAVKFTIIYNGSIDKYDKVNITVGTDTSECKIDINCIRIPSEGRIYTVKNIDEEGNFAILMGNFIECGRNPPLGVTSTKVNRFLVYDNSPVKVEVVYW